MACCCSCCHTAERVCRCPWVVCVEHRSLRGNWIQERTASAPLCGLSTRFEFRRTTEAGELQKRKYTLFQTNSCITGPAGEDSWHKEQLAILRCVFSLCAAVRSKYRRMKVVMGGSRQSESGWHYSFSGTLRQGLGGICGFGVIHPDEYVIEYSYAPGLLSGSMTGCAWNRQKKVVLPAATVSGQRQAEPERNKRKKKKS